MLGLIDEMCKLPSKAKFAQRAGLSLLHQGSSTGTGEIFERCLEEQITSPNSKLHHPVVKSNTLRQPGHSGRLGRLVVSTPDYKSKTGLGCHYNHH
jgi:hypothetical protein